MPNFFAERHTFNNESVPTLEEGRRRYITGRFEHDFPSLLLAKDISSIQEQKQHEIRNHGFNSMDLISLGD